MNTLSNHTLRPILSLRNSAAAMTVWAALICGSLLWNWTRVGDAMYELARAEARSHFDKDILYRRWAAMHGGVYVPATEKTPPNPYLAFLKNRDVVTTSGMRLTLVNPAYMTRQVHELANEQYGVRGHITSLKPLRPENAADAWETVALRSFEKGAQEAASLETVRGESVLRFMRPLMTESPCLKCHSSQGYEVGDVRGGISIQVPFEPYSRSAWNQRKPLLLGHLLIGFLGLAGLGAWQRNIAVSAKTLQESERKYRDIFSNIQDVYYRADENGNFVELSPSVLKYSGYSRDELIGKPAAGFYHNPADRLKVLETMGKTGEVTDYEIVMRRKDGRLVHASLNSHVLRDAAGKIVGVEGVLRDITERRSVEEINLQYARDLEHLLSISHETTVTTNLKSLYRTFVSASKELLNLDFSTLMLLSEDRTTLTVHDCLGFPESMIGHFSLVEGQGLATLVVKGKQPEIVADFTRETRFAVPPIVREKNILSAVAVPMMMKDKILGVLIGHTLDRRDFSAKDISLYQQIGNEAAVAIQNAINSDMIKKSEKRIRDITSSLGEGLYALDNFGHVTFMNPEAERLLGWTEAELLNKNIHDIVHNRRPDGMYLSFEDCPMHKVIGSNERFISNDEVFIRKDGGVFPVSVISAPLMEEGMVQSSITVFRDISERKQSEHEREQLIADLQKALTEIKTLHGIIPICASCKKIRDEEGAWHQMETYISEHTDSQFSHGICKDCAKKLYPKYYREET